ncbi:MAG TPA: LUD domain-containing protein [Candidatus Sphingobacterium stercoripullorum]|uniref:LUD domain-containing protein n=1 Tax=Candidatus Sphingobacterium stercoripullorum TaxID=2838759 RepID=A0A9D1W8S4_9SPHI|nr:LUD domain-containing protein [Candidatus Sphingobacterium stercoripullorum]HLR49437.1 LUD domain-containing protein [Candidatus Sphingobacterium stercoripullorum]
MRTNIRNVTPKERMLKSLRSALLQKKDNPYPDFEEDALFEDAKDSLDITFAQQLIDAKGNFVYCDGEISLIENLVLLVERIGLENIGVWEDEIIELLDIYSFPYIKDKSKVKELSCGITTCDYLIARHGSILISSANSSGRELSIFPPVHIVVARSSQLVMDVKHALEGMKSKYNPLPSMMSVITGPSRTADIEKRLVLGAHGPKELYVLMLEDRF